MNEASQQDEASQQVSPDAWESCPAGTLAQTVSEINARDRQAALKRTMRVGGGLCAALLVFVAVGLYLNSEPQNLGGLTCRQCVSHMESYHANSFTDPVLAKNVETHLEHCEACQKHYQNDFGPLRAKDSIVLAFQLPDVSWFHPGFRLFLLAHGAPSLK